MSTRFWSVYGYALDALAHYLCAMERLLQITQDGSHTIAVPGLRLTYHSMRGAVQESMHIFIRAGLQPLLGQFPQLRIFEMGMGTGLNAWLTLQQAVTQQQPVYYETVEPYPLSAAEIHGLNYGALLNNQSSCSFASLHEAPWEQDTAIHPLFTLHKMQRPLATYLGYPLRVPFHLVYFDAFDPVVQPELWAQPVFEQLYARMYTGAALLTYCSKGIVRRAMKAAGFAVEKLPGPPGKREIVRAVK
jgi:tRNA U34 5-methylaminomethyl-2-thiouridine-forming methyltransferase MnmC